MFSNILESLEYERAKFARETEYLLEDMREDDMDNCMEVAENALFPISAQDLREELTEAAEILKEVDPDDSLMEMEDIHRILHADHNLTFDEMIGIE